MALPTVPKTFTFDQWRQAYNELVGAHNVIDTNVGLLTGNLNVWQTTTTTAVNKTLEANEYCYVTSAGVSVILPITPAAGTTVGVAVGNFTNTLIGRNAQLIMGLSENMTINIANTAIILIYVNNDWRLV